MDPVPVTTDLSVLFTPGERLGWVFRDRNRYRRRFREPAPAPPPPPVQLQQRLWSSRRKLSGQVVAGVMIGLGVGLVAGVCGAVNETPGLLVPMLLLGAVIGGAVPGVDYTMLRNKVDAIRARQRQQYEEACAGWWLRKADFDRDQERRVDQLLEWGSLSPAGARRVDIVGGTLWGWEALLTVYGASLLATRGTMMLVDLSGEAVSRELLRLAEGNGESVDLLLLPRELPDSDLLVGMSARDLVDALIEAAHPGEEAASRPDRAIDDRILTGICSVLGERVTFARLAAALRVLMDEPGDVSPLTPDEQRMLAGDLFGEAYRRQAHANLSRLEAFLHPLIGLGTRLEPRAGATLTCLALATEGRNVRNELLNDLIVQWLLRRVAQGGSRPGSLVIAGADEIPRRHLERLGDLCERRDVRLVLLFRHLRGPAVQAVGGGSVVFMRLGNHEEARQAADFIGRQHRFVLAQVTRTIGGNETHTDAETEGDSMTEGRSSGRSRGRMATGLLGLGRVGRNWSSNESRSWSVTRNWSQTRSVAEGMSWSTAGAEQRVYEYEVEPRALQELPDYALVVAQRGGEGGAAVVPADCNPDLTSMPRFGMDPLPELPLPGPEETLEPAAPLPFDAVAAPQVWQAPPPAPGPYGYVPPGGPYGQPPPTWPPRQPGSGPP